MAEKNSDSKTFRKTVLTLGTVLAVFFLLAFLPKTVSFMTGAAREPPPGREWEGQVMTAMFVTFMLGYAVGWWHLLWGGLLMVLAALVVAIAFGLNENVGSLIFGIPQFVVGLLYLLLYWGEKRKRRQTCQPRETQSS